ncbi:MAG: phosphoribosyl transferase [Chitinophagaceae bacterium]|nr:MAG: phosphoribosyl transferase [Chitinophagaceae bacterium]
MNYRSVSDLNEDIKRNLHKIPNGVSLVVGVPRSGLLAANLIALYLNVPLADIDNFVEGKYYSSGARGSSRNKDPFAGTILIVDDSIFSGSALTKVKNKLKNVADKNYNLKYCCVYAFPGSELLIDVHFKLLDLPRVFEWNLWHHGVLSNACVDIDGVLCEDPTEDENDDGHKYLNFLQNALPKHVPSTPIATLVTSRLEKYRAQTEDWLSRTGIQYGELLMLDLPDKETRLRLGSHGAFKAEMYKNKPESNLFIESNREQARFIHDTTKKAVYCVDTNEMFAGDVPVSQYIRRKFSTQKNYVKSIFKLALGR